MEPIDCYLLCCIEVVAFKLEVWGLTSVVIGDREDYFNIFSSKFGVTLVTSWFNND